ncbi:MAG: TIGR04086 family membrane protein [Clostridia bacterium]|nr:TIGR04086 family membrane protein [Clostridia bacterium]
MKKMGKINKDSKSYSIAKGFIIALLISLICIFLYAVILVNTTIQEKTIKPVIITITGISILIGSSISSLKIKKKGIVNGMCVAVLYLGSFYILSSIALCGFYLNLSSIITILVGIAFGGIGGIIGVNIKRN